MALGLETRTPAPSPAVADSAPVTQSRAVWLVLAAAVILGAALRFYLLDWDAGAHLHPDERQITMVASQLALPRSGAPSTGHPPLDPHFFAYGSLPLYLLAAAGNVAHRLGLTLGQAGPALAGSGLARILLTGDAYDGMNLVGRFLSALFDTASILLCFLLGRHLYGARAGCLAAVLYAFAALAVQQAHYYVVDPILTFFILLTLLACVRVLESSRPSSSLLAGICFGLAMATKVSAAPLLLAVVLAHVLLLLRSRQRDGRITVDALQHAWQRLLLAGAGALGAFLLTEPYALLDWQQFQHDVLEQSAMARGALDYPYTRQYAHTASYFYWLQGLFTWQLTPLLTLAGLAGLAWQGWRAMRPGHDADRLLVAWWLPYLLLTGAFYAKFPRYMLPAVPLMGIAAGGLLVALIADRRRWLRIGGTAAAALTIVTAGLYCLAYMHIYATTNTRVAASAWIYANIPATTGSHQTTLTHEVWDDGLPLDLSTQSPADTAGRYAYVDLPIYDDDTLQKQQTMIADLQRADYVVEASEIVRGSILRNPRRYPMTIAYYDALADGQLGFEPVASIRSVPALFGLRFDDRSSDLNWQFYDHPPVTIYRKVRQLSPAQMAALMQVPTTPPRVSQSAGMASLDLAAAAQQADAQSPSLGQMFPSDGLGMRFPVIIWLVAVEIMGLLALPWAARLLGALPDAGYAATKPLGFLLVGWGTWFLASTGIARNTRGTSLAVLGVLAVIAVAGWLALPRWRELVQRKWRLWLTCEALFLVAFGAFVLIRAFNPDLWHLYRGGEKPMELSYLHAILRSQTLPPLDPWLSGTTINYYYFGLYLFAMLYKLTQIAPETGFNLSIPLVYAFGIQLAAAIGYALTWLLLGKARSARDQGTNVAMDDHRPGSMATLRAVARTPVQTAQEAWSAIRPQHQAGATAATVAERLDGRAALGGLAAALLFGVLGNLDTGPYLFGELVQSGGQVVRGNVPVLTGAAQLLAGLGAAIGSGGGSLPGFNYFDRTRVIPFTINEFPFFSFLYADLHPHVIDMPFTMVAIALAVALVAGSPRLANRPLEPVHVLLGGLIVGAFWPTNVWDYPIYLSLLPAALWLRRFDGRNFLRALVPAASYGAAIFAIGRLAFLPFYQHFLTLDSGIGLPSQHSDLWHFFLVYGLFLLLAGTFLIVAHRFSLESFALLLLPGLLAGLLLHSAVIGLLVTLLVLTLRLAWLRRFRQEFLAVLLLLGLAFAIVTGTELVYVKDPLQGGDYERMNTVFKFGVQVWILLSVTCGPLFVWMATRRRIAFWKPKAGAPSPAPTVTSDREAFSPYDQAAQGALGAIAGTPVQTAITAAVGKMGAVAASMTHLPTQDSPTSSVSETADSGTYRDNGAVNVSAASTDAASFAGIGAQQTDSPPPSIGGPVGPLVTPANGAALNGRSRATTAILPPWWWPVLGLFVLCAALYAPLATPAKATDRFPTSPPTPSLDGMAYMRLAYPSDYDAITWLQQHVTGDPILLEANKSIYSWYDRVSWHTGLPTLLGWDYHTSQFHGDQVVAERKQVITTIYTTPDASTALGLLSQYDVQLIYVGPLERDTYGATSAGLAKLDQMVGSSLDLIYNANGVKIYRVKGDA